MSDFLRAAAGETFVDPQSDVGDLFALDWLARLMKARPDLIDPLKDAAVKLISEGDPIVALRLLEVCGRWPGGVSTQLEATLKHADTLRTVRDPSSSIERSLLGRIVEEICRGVSSVVGPDAAAQLSTITERKHGYPKSRLLAWLADPSKIDLSQLVGSARDAELHWIASAIYRAGEPTLEKALEQLARGEEGPRSKMAAAWRQILEEIEQTAVAFQKLSSEKTYPSHVQAAIDRALEGKTWEKIRARLGL